MPASKAIELYVWPDRRSGTDRAEVVAAAAAAAPLSTLRQPLLTAGAPAVHYDVGDGELVVEQRDALGQPIVAYAWNLREKWFADRTDRKAPGVLRAGGHVGGSPGPRRLRLPLRDDTAFLVVSKNEVRPAGPGTPGLGPPKRSISTALAVRALGPLPPSVDVGWAHEMGLAIHDLDWFIPPAKLPPPPLPPRVPPRAGVAGKVPGHGPSVASPAAVSGGVTATTALRFPGRGPIAPVESPGFETRALFAMAAGPPPTKGDLARELVHAASATGPTFDVIVTGDGFKTKADLATFGRTAVSLIRWLRRVQPFARLDRHINWYVVTARSKRHGIPIVAARKKGKGKAGKKAKISTYFGVRAIRNGGLLDLSKPPRWERVQQARRLATTGPKFAELAIILLNCRRYGGHGWATTGTALFTLDGSTSPMYRYLVAHECGHAICNLAEEYVCDQRCDDRVHPRPNKATLEQVGASVRRHLQRHKLKLPTGLSAQLDAWTPKDTVWWKKLPGVRKTVSKKTRTLGVVHTPGDKYREVAGTPDAVVPRRDRDAVGAFWGCEDEFKPRKLALELERIVGGKKKEIKELCDVLAGKIPPRTTQRQSGALFYRPASRCCMRWGTSPYCRVCEHLIENHIRETCGLKPRKPFPA